MAGGSGTRLWPLSRAMYPKQFLALGGPQTLFQAAAARLTKLKSDDITVAPLCVVCNDEHRFLARDQLGAAGTHGADFILEPVGRNTAPALTLAALQAVEKNGDPILVVTPADQTVTNDAAFAGALKTAVRAAADGAIVTLGIVPDRPETGYGYIKSNGASPTARVLAFVEKPNLATAEQYVQDGGFSWNSGIFVLKASVWLRALELFRPDILAATKSAWDSCKRDNGFIRPAKEAFSSVPSESIDYAVMERAASDKEHGLRVEVVPLDAGWSDLGAWDAVWKISEQDPDGNAGVGDVMFEGSRNTLVHASSRLVTTVGVTDLVVVETPDAILIADRSNSQNVKQVVSRLSAERRTEGTLHRRVHRPWGWYDSVDAGPRFQVKRILVNPGASLSLQMHHHRAEHWIVVSGTAEVTCGERKILLSENQSTYIPLGETHRLANPGKVPLEIIEVQSGSYLGEDDIVRFEDTYGRTQ